MYARRQPSEALLRRARATALITTRGALLADGFSDRTIHGRVHDGQWQSLGKGIYRLAPEDLTWRHYAMAAGLAYGEGAAVSGASAAFAHRLLDTPPDTVSVRVPTRRTLTRVGLWVPQSDWIGRCHRGAYLRDRERLGGTVRVTWWADTVFDRLEDLATEDDVVALLTRAFSLSPRMPAVLRGALEERTRLPHRHLVMDVLDEAEGVRSVLEWRYRTCCEKPHGLPTGDLQASVRPGAVHDVAYHAYKTLLELDGLRYHDGEQRRRDQERDVRSMRDGYLTLRIGWRPVAKDPCGVAAGVAEMLRQRGWDGQFRRCPRCP